MARVVVSVTINASPGRVWSDVRDIATHTTWMADAVAIRFLSSQREGIGTTFECDTKVGPLRLTDKMEVTEWVDERAMGIRHVGLVRGTGRFELAPTDWSPGGPSGGPGHGHTRFSWDETLVFPWWMAGRVGGVVGGVVLRQIWKRILRRLKQRIEQQPASG